MSQAFFRGRKEIPRTNRHGKAADLRDIIQDKFADAAPEILAGFDRLSLNDKAWLAALGKKDLDTALDELGQSYVATTDAFSTIVEQEWPDIVANANIAMQTEYDAMAEAAADSGKDR